MRQFLPVFKWKKIRVYDAVIGAHAEGRVLVAGTLRPGSWSCPRPGPGSERGRYGRGDGPGAGAPLSSTRPGSPGLVADRLRSWGTRRWPLRVMRTEALAVQAACGPEVAVLGVQGPGARPSADAAAAGGGPRRSR